MRRALSIASIAAVVASTMVVLSGPASADPSANDWYQLRMCESTNRYDINTGNGYYGAYQFDLSTWRSVGGSGYPNEASAGGTGLPRTDPVPPARLEPVDLRHHRRAVGGFRRRLRRAAAGRRQPGRRWRRRGRG